jgi:hypothetical protein
VTRGKSVCGKTLEGIDDAAYTPPRHRPTAMKKIAFQWRVESCPMARGMGLKASAGTVNR